MREEAGDWSDPEMSGVFSTKPLLRPPYGREANTVWSPGLHLLHSVPKTVS